MAATHATIPMTGQCFLGIPPQRITGGPTTQRIAAQAVSSKSFSKLN